MANLSCRISDETGAMLDEIIAKDNITKTKLIEQLISEYYSRSDDEVGANCQKKNNVSADTDGFNEEYRELLKLIKYIVNDNNKKLFILHEVINSLIMTTFKCFPERFKSTTIPTETHDWFLHAEDMLQKILNEKMAMKKLRGE